MADRRMFYGWIVVGAGMLITCVGMASMFAWLVIGSTAIGIGAIAIAFTFRPPRVLGAPLPSPA